MLSIHGNTSSYTASEDIEVWIAKEEMDRFHIFIADFFFLPFQTAEHNYFKAGNATSVCFYHGFCFETSSL